MANHTGPVAGRADVLVVPDLESGNMLAKQLEYLAEAELAGVVLGARVPIILTSRADTPKTRLASAAVAALLSRASGRPLRLRPDLRSPRRLRRYAVNPYVIHPFRIRH